MLCVIFRLFDNGMLIAGHPTKLAITVFLSDLQSANTSGVGSG